jgi:hypothetical protein
MDRWTCTRFAFIEPIDIGPDALYDSAHCVLVAGRLRDPQCVRRRTDISEGRAYALRWISTCAFVQELTQSTGANRYGNDLQRW